MNNNVTVTQIVKYAKTRFDQDVFLNNLLVEGELSNVTKHKSGHVYFTLKDDHSRISCVMFASALRYQAFTYNNGQKVIVKARLSIFEATGQMQLYVTQIKEAGLGDLYLKFEQLKQALATAGYFNAEHKKPVPKYPFSIAIITGRDTAALKDIITTLNRRWPVAKRYLFYTLVQGEQAAAEITNRLYEVDQLGVDVIILARGGGSIEDLWAFNNETLVKTIYNLNTPIITGVGHETDVTLVDYVADLRAPTPTGAAELATPNIIDVKQQLLSLQQGLNQTLQRQIQSYRQQLDYLQSNRIFQNPEIMLSDYYLSLILYQKGFDHWLNQFKNKRQEVFYLNNRINQSMMALIRHQQQTNQHYFSQLHQAMQHQLTQQQKAFANYINLIQAYSPLNTLKRGYSITSHQDKVITALNDIQVGDIMKTRLKDGILTSKVIKKE